ncbi:MAG: PEGA domain-containing protein [Candidatus Omnitrophica bacterium]|nr:PEGA domain-containing protein [Candidatus Omnitrophota bacterium]
MLLLLRKILFYFFLVAYFLLIPYVILYALGYIFNPVERSLVKTGLISVATYPKYATVHIQGKKFSEKTPTRVNDLLPGRYRIRVSKKGFDSWEKEIEIFPEKAVQLEPIVLLPLRPEREVISSQGYAGMLPFIVESKIIAWTNKELGSLRKVDLFFKKDTPIRFSGFQKEFPKISDIFIRKGSEIAILKTESKGKPGYWCLDPTRERKVIQDLSPLVTFIPKSVSWDPHDPDQIYFLHDGGLDLIDRSRMAIEPKIATGVIGFGADYRRLVLLKKDFSLVETDPHGRHPEPLLGDPVLSQQIFSPESSNTYRIEVLQRDLLIFLSDQGALISNRMPYHLVDKDVIGVEYTEHADTEKLLFWTQRTVGVIDFSRMKGGLFELGPKRILLYQSGQKIRQAFWAYDDTHVIFVDNQKVYLLEAKEPWPYQVRFLEQIAPDTLVEYSDRRRSLYFIDSQTRHLIRRKLVD